MVYSKRGGCCCAFAFVLEAIALAAALIAITGTFWLESAVFRPAHVLQGLVHEVWPVYVKASPAACGSGSAPSVSRSMSPRRIAARRTPCAAALRM